MNLTNQLLKIWLKVDEGSAADLLYVLIKLGSGFVAFQNLSFTELLATGGRSGAHQAYLLSTIKPGEWTPITLGPPSFAGIGEANLQPVDYGHIQDFEVAVAGTKGNRTKVSFGGMEVVPGDRRYPRGVVSFTFDDGLSSPYRHALPALAAHGFPATAYVIHDLIEAPGANGSYLSQTQLRDLATHGWEVAAHSNLIADHNARYGFLGVPPGRLRQDVDKEIAWLRQSGFNGAADLALPQGWFDRELLRLLAPRFETIRTVDFRSIETLPVADPHRLRARLYDPTQKIGPASKPGSVKWRIDQVARYGGWLILGFHDMSSHGTSAGAPIINEGSAIKDTDFSDIVAYVAQRGVPVRTVRQVWSSRPGVA